MTDRFVGPRRFFVYGIFLSRTGSAMAMLATSYVIYDQTQSVVASALIAACACIPAVLLLGAANSIAGRWNEAQVFVCAGTVIGALGVIPVVFSATGHLAPENLLLWLVALGIVSGLSAPALPMVTRALAPPGEMPEFNARLGRVRALATVIGLILGGVIYDVIGPTWVYAFNAVSCVFPVLAVIPLVRLARIPRIHQNLRTTWAVRKGQPGLRAVFAAAIALFLGSSFTVTLPALSQQVGSSASILSAMNVALVIGGLFIVLTVRRLHGRAPWGSVQRACVLTIVSGLVGLLFVTGFNNAKWLFAAALFLLVVIGYAQAIDTAVLASIVQLHAPVEARAGVLIWYHAVPMVTVPIGKLGVGVIADKASLAAAYGCCALVLAFCLLLGRHLGIHTAIDRLNDSGTPPDVVVAPRIAHNGVPQ
ncbi:MAG: MFS transporter [Thermoleophilia bacterium]